MGEQRLQDERDKQNERLVIRAIEARDDVAIARIIRHNLEVCGLDRPGTAYFDPELDNLSRYYLASPHRAYFIAELDGTVVGGAGASPVAGATGTAELQKLYVAPEAQRRGIATALTLAVEDFARRAGFSTLYLETHHDLMAAIALYRALDYAEDDRPLLKPHTTMDTCSLRAIAAGGRAKGALINGAKDSLQRTRAPPSDRELRPILVAGLGKHRANPVSHRTFADKRFRCDLVVVEPFGHQANNLVFALRQAFKLARTGVGLRGGGSRRARNGASTCSGPLVRHARATGRRPHRRQSIAHAKLALNKIVARTSCQVALGRKRAGSHG